jgi:hypothetical protein
MTIDEERAEWEENNNGFEFDPRDENPELWSRDDYTELWDRMIQRRETWVCQECLKPCTSLDEARRHVSNQHGEKLIDQAKPPQEDD